MKNFLLTLVIVVLFTSCTKKVQEFKRPDEITDAVFQYSTKVDLSNGVYEGNLKVSELLQNGNFGIGTFNGIEGEMVVKDGISYRVKHEGEIAEASEEEIIPFANVKFFKTDTSFSITGTHSIDSVKNSLVGILENKGMIAAIRITGNFEYVKTRSVPKQQQPFPPLTEVIAQQNIFERNNVAGSVIGFWMPEKLDNVNFPGYHFHFLDNDLSIGGHVLDFTSSEIKVEIDYADKLNLTLIK